MGKAIEITRLDRSAADLRSIAITHQSVIKTTFPLYEALPGAISVG
jgi:hypothetical protein